MKGKEVGSLIVSQRLGLCGVLEAKVRKTNLAAICTRCFPCSWKCLDNSGNSDIARIVLGWDLCCLDVSLVYSDDQLICVQATCLSSQRVFYASVVYGANSLVCRRSLWSAMRCLFSVIGDSPWIQLGDFNVALRSSERMGDFDSSAAGEFNQCLIDINMEELATRGSWFTWSNKRGGGGANMSRIDRVLVNGDWLDMFPNLRLFLMCLVSLITVLCWLLSSRKLLARSLFVFLIFG